MRLNLGISRVPLDDDDPVPPQHDLLAASSGVLERMYREERPGLLRFVLRKSRREDAEDVVQQIFARFAARGRVEPLENPAAYLRQSAINLMRDNARAVRRNPVSEILGEEILELPGLDQEARLQARDRLARVEAAVSKLKPLTRQIFLARRVYGYSLSEIAEQTGLSIKGVERQMSIAIKKLGRHLRSHD